jgi:thioredoxin 1
MKLLKFSRPNCPPCFRVGAYLESKGIQAEEYNVYDEKDAEVANKYNIQTVPVLLLVNGEDVVEQVFGFNESDIDNLLAQL